MARRDPFRDLVESILAGRNVGTRHAKKDLNREYKRNRGLVGSILRGRNINTPAAQRPRRWAQKPLYPRWKEFVKRIGRNIERRSSKRIQRFAAEQARIDRARKSDLTVGAQRSLAAVNVGLNQLAKAYSSNIIYTRIIPIVFQTLVEASPYDSGRLISYWNLDPFGQQTIPLPLAGFKTNAQYNVKIPQGRAEYKAWENMMYGLSRMISSNATNFKITNVTPYLFAFPELVAAWWSLLAGKDRRGVPINLGRVIADQRFNIRGSNVLLWGLSGTRRRFYRGKIDTVIKQNLFRMKGTMRKFFNTPIHSYRIVSRALS